MSRIGLKRIDIPAGVSVALTDNTLKVKGKLGELTHTVPSVIETKVEDNGISFTRVNEEKHTKQLHGTTRALVQNIVTGVSTGYKKQLVINGVGYRAAMNGKDLELQVGFSHKVIVSPLPGITISLKSPTEIIVEGIDKQVVGEMAAYIRLRRKPDHYKNKGISYLGERIILKKGKKGTKK